MVMLTQAPNGRCTLTRHLSSSSPQYPNKPKFISRKNFTKPLVNLSLVANSNAPDSSSPTSTPPPPPPFEDQDQTVFVGDDRVPLEGVIQLDKPSFSEQLNKWGRVALLSGGDVLALLLFSAIGRFSHGFPVFDAETLHTADPFIAGWFLSAYFLGAYGSDGRGMEGSSKALTATAKSWAVGIPLGIIIRAATSGHVPPVRFVVVTMGATAVLLIGWRALLYTILPKDKKNDVYKRGSPFELFEVLLSIKRFLCFWARAFEECRGVIFEHLVASWGDTMFSGDMELVAYVHVGLFV